MICCVAPGNFLPLLNTSAGLSSKPTQYLMDMRLIRDRIVEQGLFCTTSGEQAIRGSVRRKCGCLVLSLYLSLPLSISLRRSSLVAEGKSISFCRVELEES